jgi:hypothetical protein
MNGPPSQTRSLAQKAVQGKLALHSQLYREITSEKDSMSTCADGRFRYPGNLPNTRHLDAVLASPVRGSGPRDGPACACDRRHEEATKKPQNDDHIVHMRDAILDIPMRLQSVPGTSECRPTPGSTGSRYRGPRPYVSRIGLGWY